jgi:hypothetical protein
LIGFGSDVENLPGSTRATSRFLQAHVRVHELR